MESLNWKDVPETRSSAKQTAPWFGATMFLIGLIMGFILGNFINV